MSSIFHPGPIDVAISSAVAQGIPLVFFVADDGEQSRKWENVWLKSTDVLPQLQTQSILLKLKQGSTEAAFLAAFSPAQQVPYLVAVKNGALLATIPHDAPQATFMQHLQTLFPPPPAPAAAASPTAALFAERKARLEAQDVQRRARDKADRLARNAHEKALREAENPDRVKYLAQQKKLRDDEKAEKQRILLLVEDDKIERREREARKRQSRWAVSGSGSGSGSAERAAVEEAEMKRERPERGETAIAFRLLDGSVLKGRFQSTMRLKEVRGWLDLNRTDDPSPYTFQQVLPNKELSAFEENSSLAELSFAHTTTLVLVHRVGQE